MIPQLIGREGMRHAPSGNELNFCCCCSALEPIPTTHSTIDCPGRSHSNSKHYSPYYYAYASVSTSVGQYFWMADGLVI